MNGLVVISLAISLTIYLPITTSMIVYIMALIMHRDNTDLYKFKDTILVFLPILLFLILILHLSLVIGAIHDNAICIN